MANPPINEIAKHWLLTSAIDFPRGLGYFFRKVHELALNMREVPGCAPAGYAAALRDLFDLGMIEFSSALQEDDVKTRTGVSNVLDRFLTFSRENPDHRLIRRVGEAPALGPCADRPDLNVKFRLTDAGGDAWEQTAEPDWLHFFGQSHDIENGEIFSQDLTLLMARLGWFNELASAQVAVDTIELQTHSDYQILYWKRLPNVYRVTFSVTDAEPRWPCSGSLEPKWFRDWWHSTTEWYKKPWDLPNWPTQ